jgi:hypothetical protein
MTTAFTLIPEWLIALTMANAFSLKPTEWPCTMPDCPKAVTLKQIAASTSTTIYFGLHIFQHHNRELSRGVKAS